MYVKGMCIVMLLTGKCIHITGHSDLTNRFVIVCNTAVDWVLYGVEPYSSEHAQFLQDEDTTLPSSISMEMDTNKGRMDIAFLRHLLHFFHKTLQPALRKVRGIGWSYTKWKEFMCCIRLCC